MTSIHEYVWSVLTALEPMLPRVRSALCFMPVFGSQLGLPLLHSTATQTRLLAQSHWHHPGVTHAISVLSNTSLSLSQPTRLIDPPRRGC